MPFRIGVLHVGVGLLALGQLAVAAELRSIWKFTFGQEHFDLTRWNFYQGLMSVRVGVLDVGAGLPALGQLAVAAELCSFW